jgi:hypothetical protein
MSFARVIASLGLAVIAASCRGYDTIPIQEADWQRIQPELVGMPSARLWRCAGPPLREEEGSSGEATMVYRHADLTNYCEVKLVLAGGKVRAFSAEHAAPEFLWLLDGSNYCGRIFEDCIR